MIMEFNEREKLSFCDLGRYSMNFSQTLNGFIARLDCTASELCTAAGLSPATISRYRAGERVPDVQSATFSALCDAIANRSQQRAAEEALTAQQVRAAFLSCPDITAAGPSQLGASGYAHPRAAAASGPDLSGDELRCFNSVALSLRRPPTSRPGPVCSRRRPVCCRTGEGCGIPRRPCYAAGLLGSVAGGQCRRLCAAAGLAAGCGPRATGQRLRIPRKARRL